VAGKKLHWVDRETGELHGVEVYVAILGHSQLTFVKAVASQKKEDFIGATQDALHYFGGVPRLLVPDNRAAAA
jgi:transposase